MLTKNIKNIKNTKKIWANKYKNNGKQTRARAAQEGYCIFPFKEKKRGPLYDKCIKGAEGDWCATELEDEETRMMKKWGFCVYDDNNKNKHIKSFN